MIILKGNFSGEEETISLNFTSDGSEMALD